jgi:hypothetical protein
MEADLDVGLCMSLIFLAQLALSWRFGSVSIEPKVTGATVAVFGSLCAGAVAIDLIDLFWTPLAFGVGLVGSLAAPGLWLMRQILRVIKAGAR